MEASIIIPAYNEADNLPGCLAAAESAALAAGLAGEFEIVVVDNNSTDATAAVAAAHGAKVVFEPHNQISRARNAGAAAAAGKYFFFIDADTLAPPELLSKALDSLRGGACCGGGAGVTFDQPVGAMFQATLKLWNWFSSTCGYAAGSFVFCRRDGFEAVGGFSEKVYASEEIWFSAALRRWGARRGMRFIIVSEHPVVTSSRKIQWSTPFSNAALLALVLFFPFFVRFRCLCFLWYRRPQVRENI